MDATEALFDLDTLRTVEAQAIADTDGGEQSLMQRAGAAALARLRLTWPQARRLLVLAGPGNNGGDGCVLAQLARQAGLQALVVRTAAGQPRTPAAQAAQARWLAAGGQEQVFDGALPRADVVVDALYGIGLARGLEGDDAALVAAANALELPVLALDVPSGVLAASGAVPGVAIRASHTLAFLLPLAGLRCGPARDHVGHYHCDPLGITAPAGLVPRARVLAQERLAAWLPPRPPGAHKGMHGHVLVIGGDHGTGGAVMLAAEAALRSGAGLVSVATRRAHVPALLARLPEAMVFDADDAALLEARLQAAGCVVLGPGLGQGEWGRQLYALALGAGRPLLLDADALNLLAAAPRPLSGAVLTPHPGEAARLLGSSVAGVQGDRLPALAQLCTRYRAAVVLKGAGSLVGAPDALPALVEAGNPGMGVGGMGDVLSGVIAALIGQGLNAHVAAQAGTLMHAVAGDRAAGPHPRGLLPTDLMPHLRVLANPEAVR